MRIVITSGPTWERIDAVRYIGNRSSGKVGVALAQAAAAAGHEVTLLLGPQLPDPDWPHGCATHRVVRFESCADLEYALTRHFCDQDVLVMAAAVADFRPAEVIGGKRRRQEDVAAASDLDEEGGWTLRLRPTRDLVALMARRKQPHQRVIAFALEEAETLRERAGHKLVRKGVDAIVANPLETMGADDIDPVWLSARGPSDAPGRMAKTDFAHWLLEKIEKMP